MATPSSIYKDPASNRLFYKDASGAMQPISDPTQLATLAKQGAILPYQAASTYKPYTPPAPQAQPQPQGQAQAPGSSVAPAPIPDSQPLTTPQAPAQGSLMAFQQAVGQIMAKAQYNQGLQDQMKTLLQAKYDKTPGLDISKMPLAVQQAIETGNQELIDYQITNLRSQIQGRATAETESIKDLVSGFKDEFKAIQDKQDKAFSIFTTMLDKNPQLYSVMSPEGVQAVMSGNMPSVSDVIKVGNAYPNVVASAAGREFVPATKYQQSGFFDKTTGKFTPIGAAGGRADAGGGAAGEVPANVLLDPTSVPETPKQTFEQFLAEREKAAQTTFNQTKRDALKKEFDALQKIQEKPPVSVDVSKFADVVQQIIPRDKGGLGITDFDKLSAADKKKYAAQINQAARLGLIDPDIALRTAQRQDQRETLMDANRILTGIGFKTDPRIKGYRDARANINRINATDAKLRQMSKDYSIGNAPTDLELIDGYVRMATGNAVTEAQVNSIKQNQSILGLALNIDKKAKYGGFLTPDSRRQIIELSKELLAQTKSTSEEASAEYQSLIDQQGIDFKITPDSSLLISDTDSSSSGSTSSGVSYTVETP